MNTKPIFVIRFLYQEENIDKYLQMPKQLMEELSDYHVLCPMDNTVKRVEFEVSNSTNVTDKDIEEIKTMLLKSLDNVVKMVANDIKNFDK